MKIIVLALVFLLTPTDTMGNGFLVKDSPLPFITNDTLYVKVLHVINPRFKRLSTKQIIALLERTDAFSKDFFGIHIKVSSIDTMHINHLFNLVPKDAAVRFMSYAYPFRSMTAPNRALVKSIQYYFSHSDTNITPAFDYARIYEPSLSKYTGAEAFVGALVTTHLSRLRQWLYQDAGDGKPVIDEFPYNEYMLWNAIGYGNLPYDIIITNQIIASIEYYTTSIHTALRGGVTLGFSSYSKSSKYGAFALFSTFALLNDYKTLTALRHPYSLTEKDIIKYGGAVLSHEIGHLAFRLGHPYSRTECIMRPVPLLHFTKWYDRLDAKKCPIGSSSEMQPNILPIRYDPSLVAGPCRPIKDINRKGSESCNIQ